MLIPHYFCLMWLVTICYTPFSSAALIFCCKLGSPFVIHAQGQTRDSHFGFTENLILSDKIVQFFIYFFLLWVFSKLCRRNITQFKLYAVQFEQDYDYIRPIYYFMWLLMILCTQPTQRITFSMNNK